MAAQSMSTLGSFYDALFELSAKEGAKRGVNAVPDLVPSAVSDNIADGIITTVSGLTGMDSIAAELHKKAGASLGLKAGLGTNLYRGIVYDNPLNAKKLSVEFKDNEGMSLYDNPARSTTYTMSLNVNPTNVNAVLLDSNGFADGLVDSYWESRDLIQKVNVIKFLGGEEKRTVAGNSFVKNRIINKLDNDIAAAVAVAEQSHIDSAGFENNDFRVKHATIEDSKEQYIEKHKSQKAKDKDLRQDQAKAAFEEGKREGSLSTAMGMFAGIMDSDEREEFADFYQKKMKKKIQEEYNNSIKGTTYVKNIDEVFNQIVGSIDGSEAKLFDPATNMGKGDLLQHSYLKVLGDLHLDNSLSPTLRKNLSQLNKGIVDTGKFTSMLQSYSKGVGSTKDTSHMVSLGINELRNTQLGRPLTRREQQKIRALEFARDGLENIQVETNFRYRIANAGAYALYRWKTLPAIDKVFTPFNMLTGKTWLDMANLSGGITGRGTVGISYAGQSYSLPGSNEKYTKNRWGIKTNYKRSEKFKKEYSVLAKELRKLRRDKKGLYKNGNPDRVKLDKLEKRIKILEKKKLELAEKEHSERDERVKGSGLARPITVIDHKANFMQKGFYSLYVYSPGAWWGGLANGDTFQRMFHIGTGFGRYSSEEHREKWKWSARFADKVLSSKAYHKFMKINGTITWIRDAPLRLINKASEAIKKKLKMAFIKLMKKLLTEAVYDAIAVFTAGASKVVQITYAILNFVTFGELDKVAKATMKIIMQIFVGAIGGIIVMTVFGLDSLFNSGSPSVIADNIGNGATFAPDPSYHPRLAEIPDRPVDESEDGVGVNCQNGVVITPTARVEPVFSPVLHTVQDSTGHGIDVSHWDNSIKWRSVKGNGVNFAIMKATEGTGFQDSKFKYNYKESKKAGVKRSAYHFFRPNIDGYSQANYFLNKIYKDGKKDFGDIVFAVDIEMTDYLDMSCGTELGADNLKAFLDQVRDMTGVVPMIYTNAGQWDSVVGSPSWGGDTYPLWIAHWNQTGPTNLPPGWSDWLVWQCADDGQVSGINGNVDLNVWKTGSPHCWN